uniref:Uncharacterized protein n=1 Tax=Haptolina brevifila TaxID=156173 RepID=A0A7S2JSC5_9EUKA
MKVAGSLTRCQYDAQFFAVVTGLNGQPTLLGCGTSVASLFEGTESATVDGEGSSSASIMPPAASAGSISAISRQHQLAAPTEQWRCYSRLSRHTVLWVVGGCRLNGCIDGTHLLRMAQPPVYRSGSP